MSRLFHTTFDMSRQACNYCEYHTVQNDALHIAEDDMIAQVPFLIRAYWYA